MLSILDFVTRALQHDMVRWVLALLVANFVTGVLVALSPHTPERFRFGALADWMYNAFLLVAAAVTVQALVYYATSDYRPILEPASLATWAFVLAKLVGKIVENLRDLGVPLPEVLGDRRKVLSQPTP